MDYRRSIYLDMKYIYTQSIMYGIMLKIIDITKK